MLDLTCLGVNDLLLRVFRDQPSEVRRVVDRRRREERHGQTGDRTQRGGRMVVLQVLFVTSRCTTVVCGLRL